MPANAYIHIPFCKKKCKYCSFISFTKTELITGYIYSLLKEITDNYNGEPLKTLYFGGGTPSIVPAELIGKIVKKFNFLPESEVTLEVNPDDSDSEYMNAIKNIGINRISIGAQTFDNKTLELMGRRHNSEQIISAVKQAKDVGLNNISVDLMYGLPNQTLEDIKYDLKQFLELEIRHISTYGLKIEEEAEWGKVPPPNLPNDDIQADMYEEINNVLEKSGFRRYEISNFAQEGFESKHNLNYWNNNEYYGFGVAAHGYVGGIRYSNKKTIEKYMENPAAHEFGKLLTNNEKLEEEIFLGFRKTEGINCQKIKERFNIDFEAKYGNIIDRYQDYIEKTEAGYKLNLKGIMLSNIILADFLH